jgi:MoxR-like ATPase
MQEKQVTIEGENRILHRPFMVIASQLPYGSEGMYPLTEVQADRFMFRLGATT